MITKAMYDHGMRSMYTYIANFVHTQRHVLDQSLCWEMLGICCDGMLD